MMKSNIKQWPHFVGRQHSRNIIELFHSCIKAFRQTILDECAKEKGGNTSDMKVIKKSLFLW